jgi:hypothetical protein
VLGKERTLQQPYRFCSKKIAIFLAVEAEVSAPDTLIFSAIVFSFVMADHTTKVELEKQASQI